MSEPHKFRQVYVHETCASFPSVCDALHGTLSACFGPHHEKPLRMVHSIKITSSQLTSPRHRCRRSCFSHNQVDSSPSCIYIYTNTQAITSRCWLWRRAGLRPLLLLPQVRLLIALRLVGEPTGSRAVVHVLSGGGRGGGHA